MESVETFYSAKYDSNKKFIACYVHDDFFSTDFRLNATREIDAAIADIDSKIPEYIALKIQGREQELAGSVE